MTRCCVETRRARPLLGTYVEIAASGVERLALDAAIDKAFAAVETVHRLMSFQDPASELSRLNRGGRDAMDALHSWTEEVLATAATLQTQSNGAFNPVCGGNGVDLSGIAKGFAVDRAVEALRAAGVVRGVVNAGGDLAAFGAADVEVAVRDPADAARLATVVTLRDGAFASSGRIVDGAIDGASVRAPTCMIADALTKVVGVMGEAARPLLQTYGAAALMFTHGRMVVLED